MAFQVTQCPGCESTFNTNAHILRSAAGKVRCGACLTVFDAAQNFIAEFDADEDEDTSVFVGNNPADYFNPSLFITRSALTSPDPLPDTITHESDAQPDSPAIGEWSPTETEKTLDPLQHATTSSLTPAIRIAPDADSDREPLSAGSASAHEQEPAEQDILPIAQASADDEAFAGEAPLAPSLPATPPETETEQDVPATDFDSSLSAAELESGHSRTGAGKNATESDSEFESPTEPMPEAASGHPHEEEIPETASRLPGPSRSPPEEPGDEAIDTGDHAGEPPKPETLSAGAHSSFMPDELIFNYIDDPEDFLAAVAEELETGLAEGDYEPDPPSDPAQPTADSDPAPAKIDHQDKPEQPAPEPALRSAPEDIRLHASFSMYRNLAPSTVAAQSESDDFESADTHRHIDEAAASDAITFDSSSDSTFDSTSAATSVTTSFTTTDEEQHALPDELTSEPEHNIAAGPDDLLTQSAPFSAAEPEASAEPLHEDPDIDMIDVDVFEYVASSSTTSEEPASTAHLAEAADPDNDFDLSALFTVASDPDDVSKASAETESDDAATPGQHDGATTESDLVAAPEPDNDTATEADLDAAPASDDDTVTESELDAAPEPDHDTPAESELDAAPEPGHDTLAESELDAAPEPDHDTPAESELDGALEPDHDTLAESELDGALESDHVSLAEPDLVTATEPDYEPGYEPATESDLDAAPAADDDTVAKSELDAAPESDHVSLAEPDLVTATEPDYEPATEADLDAAPAADDDTVAKSELDGALESDYETVPESKLVALSEPHHDPVAESDLVGASAPDDDTATEPELDAAPAPDDDTATESEPVAASETDQLASATTTADSPITPESDADSNLAGDSDLPETTDTASQTDATAATATEHPASSLASLTPPPPVSPAVEDDDYLEDPNFKIAAATLLADDFTDDEVVRGDALRAQKSIDEPIFDAADVIDEDQVLTEAEDSTETIRARAFRTQFLDDEALEALPLESRSALAKDLPPVELTGGQASRWGQRLLLGSACVLLTVTLLAQFMWQRLPVYSRTAQFRPLYEFACGYVNCELPVYSEISAIRSDNLVVRSHQTADNALTVSLSFRNTAQFPQPFPILILSFNSATNAIIALREFAPSEYLDAGLRDIAEMPVLSPVQVELDVMDPGADAVNYTVAFRRP